VTTVVYAVLGIDLESGRGVLGHWGGDGAEGANFWLSVVTDSQAHGVDGIFTTCCSRADRLQRGHPERVP